ncbi:DUF448 domain-containing protein [Defluviicoccus vanus]|uniref:DUF448 domain-containing protein n=1 Tax=Defluviicoccus vanus TaxID=111831 RepID=UPI001CBA68EE
MRRCLVTGVTHPASELIRFVVSPEGRVVPDVAGRLPGRGMWVQSDRAILERACTRNLFRPRRARRGGGSARSGGARGNTGAAAFP